MKDKFSISGMSCSACSAGIERAICRLDGVEKAEVSLMGETMVVEYDEDKLTKEKLIQTVIDLGYGATLYNEQTLQSKKAQPDLLKKRFLISIIFLIPIMYLSMGHMISLPTPPHWINFSLQALLALIVIIVNFKFYTSGIKFKIDDNYDKSQQCLQRKIYPMRRRRQRNHMPH